MVAVSGSENTIPLSSMHNVWGCVGGSRSALAANPARLPDS
jgi:hypothetical protein